MSVPSMMSGGHTIRTITVPSDATNGGRGSHCDPGCPQLPFGQCPLVHHIYIYNGGKVTDVYKRKAASPWCLSGSGTIGCQLANLTGCTGRYK